MIYTLMDANKVTMDAIANELISTPENLAFLNNVNGSLIELMVEKLNFGQKTVIFYDHNKRYVTFTAVKTMYSESKFLKSQILSISHNRMTAIYTLFSRWSQNGNNKRNAKNPFKCKAFMEYTKEMPIYNADYILFMA